MNEKIDLTENYNALVCAIIEQAVKDGVGLWFFKSDWYELLTTNLPLLQNGEAIYEQMMKNKPAGLPSNMHGQILKGKRKRRRRIRRIFE